MKKTTKIIIYNIIFILFVFLIIEFICFLRLYSFCASSVSGNKSYSSEEKKDKIPKLNTVFKLKYLKNSFLDKTDFRRPQGLKYNDNTKNTSPIVLLGCSFAAGYGLNENENFSYHLSEQVKRPVYNLAVVGGGLRETLYILRSKKLRTELLPNINESKYFIYTYMSSHSDRLYVNFRPHVPNFRYDNSYKTLKYYKDYLNNKTCIVPELMSLYANYFQDKEKTFNLIKLYLIQIKNVINKNFNNYDESTKFIVLVYNDIDNFNWEELEKENIIVFHTQNLVDVDLSSEEYNIADKVHPNGKAWEVIVPALVKELDL